MRVYVVHNPPHIQPVSLVLHGLVGFLLLDFLHPDLYKIRVYVLCRTALIELKGRKPGESSSKQKSNNGRTSDAGQASMLYEDIARFELCMTEEQLAENGYVVSLPEDNPPLPTLSDMSASGMLIEHVQRIYYFSLEMCARR